MSACRPTFIMLAALALSMGEAAAAEQPTAVRTPEPYQAGKSENARVLRPLPVVSPPAARRQETRPSAPACPTTTNQVINVIIPAFGSEAEDALVRIDAPPGGSRIELRVRRESHDQAPAGPAPRPIAVPVAPVVPGTSPLPVATPVPTPIATPVPGPTLPPRPIVRKVGLAPGLPFISEVYQTGAIDVAPGPVPRIGLASRYDLVPGFSLSGSLDYQRYTLVDTQHTPSRHQRQELIAQAAAWGALPTSGPDMWVGLGYWGRMVNVTNSLPPPLTTPLITSPFQLFHGPQALLRAEQPLIPGLTATAEVTVRPYLFAVGDEAVAPLTPLYGVALNLEAGYALSDNVVLVGGLRYERLGSYGEGFAHTGIGPVLRADWRF